MKRRSGIVPFVLVLAALVRGGGATETIKMVPFHQVRMDDAIWRPRIRDLVKNTLPHAFKNTEVGLNRLRLCAEFLENKGGPKPRPHRFNTSDLYKVMEGGALMIQSEPKSSVDDSIPRWTSWPQRGKAQWVQIDLDAIKQVRSIGVYWYNDNGGVQLPGSWHVEVPENGRWKKIAIYNTDQYSSLPNSYNTVHPAKALKADKVRIVMKPRHDKTCVGILLAIIETK